MRRAAFLICLCLLTDLAQAHLPYMPLRMALSASKSSFRASERMELTLTITNTDRDSTFPIMVPGKQATGRKLVYVKVFKVVGNRSELVAEESPVLYQDYGNAEVKQLGPGQQLSIRFVLNDRKANTSLSANNHFLNKRLRPGSYYIQAFYDPEYMAPFNLYDFIWSTNEDVSGKKLIFWKGGNPSEPCTINIEPSPTSQARTCGPGCRFCRQVTEQEWNKVAALINSYTRNESDHRENNYAATDSSWMLSHRSVADVHATADCIMACLPAYAPYQAGFRQNDTVLYFNMVFQLGKVYHPRSRLRTVLSWMFRTDVNIRTSDEDYIGLASFKPADKIVRLQPRPR